MLKDYIILESLTPKGKTSIARLGINGKYNIMCECRWLSHAEAILKALQNDSFNGKLVDIYRQAAE